MAKITTNTPDGNITITPNGTGEVDISKVDIDGGTIDGTTIGGTDPAAGTFTTFTSTGIDDNASSTALTIDSSGDVGVGYSSPSAKLHVNGSSINGDILKLTGTGVENRGLTVSNFAVSGVNGVGIDFDAIGSSGTGGTLSFSTNSTERMRIDSSGNVTMQGSLTAGTLGSGVVFPSGTTISGQVGGGHILQVQSVSKTDTWSGTISTANSDTAITGLSAKITPSSTSNKIAIFITVHGGSNESGREAAFAIRLYRGATEIGAPSSPGTDRPAGIAALDILGTSNNTVIGCINTHFVDSPSSTSELTYAVYMLNQYSTSQTFYVNRTVIDNDANYRNRVISTITLMEIQG